MKMHIVEQSHSDCF